MDIMLLGTIHLGDTTDVVQLDAGDRAMYTDEDFEVLAKKLAEFEPDQIFVEVNTSDQEVLDQQYARYVNESLPVINNEVYQIAFRVAKHLKHDRVWAVDWNEERPGIPNLADISLPSSQAEFQKIIERAGEQMQRAKEVIRTGTIVDLFKFINNQEQYWKDHQIYVDLMQLEDDAAFEWTASYWYYRNLKIVKNIRASAKVDTKKSIILYGGGHNYLLQQMLNDVPSYNTIPFGEFNK